METVATLSVLGLIFGLVIFFIAVINLRLYIICFSIVFSLGCCILLFISNGEIGQNEKDYIKEHYLNPEYAACKEKVPDIIINRIAFSRYKSCVEEIDKINEFKELRGEK